MGEIDLLRPFNQYVLQDKTGTICASPPPPLDLLVWGWCLPDATHLARVAGKVQGYVAHKKQFPLGLPKDHSHSATVGSYGGAISYGRGTQLPAVKFRSPFQHSGRKTSSSRPRPNRRENKPQNWFPGAVRQHRPRQENLGTIMVRIT